MRSIPELGQLTMRMALRSFGQQELCSPMPFSSILENTALLKVCVVFSTSPQELLYTYTEKRLNVLEEILDPPKLLTLFFHQNVNVEALRFLLVNLERLFLDALSLSVELLVLGVAILHAFLDRCVSLIWLHTQCDGSPCNFAL
jgi:hypothetical protein